MAAKTGRTGLIARKLGMSRLFNEDGSTVPVTHAMTSQAATTMRPWSTSRAPGSRSRSRIPAP